MTTEELSKSTAEYNNGCTKDSPKQRDVKNNGIPPPKIFCYRNSMLTDLMQLNHLQTVYNISVAVCSLLILTSISYYLADPEKFWEDISVMQWAVSKMHIFVAVWLGLNMLCIAVHQVFCFWVRNRHFLTKVMDISFLLFIIGVWVLMCLAPPYNVVKFELPSITALSLLSEQVRMLMKIYSFVRENYPKVRQQDLSKGGQSKKITSFCPPLKHFVYYMFAPVLLYRDSYPRNAVIHWSNVVINFLKVIACIFIAYCLFHAFITTTFKQIGVEYFSLPKWILIYAGCVAVGSTMMFLVFYAILHSWLNTFAELLKFGDRLFYTDWWNSTSFSQYYRRWNSVVYEWLYAYIYGDMRKLGFNRTLSTLTVFVISAAVHEYINCFTFGFFFPALAIVYCIVGVPMVFITRNRRTQVWNTLMWGFLFSGWGLLIMLYSLEWYSRKNCIRRNDDALQYLPVFLTCGVLKPS